MWANIVLYRVNMDTISALLQRARLEASLDRRCLLSRSTNMPVTAHGPRQAPFHVLMAGRCRFHTAEQAFDMAPGDVVLLPSGRMHRITVDGPGRMAGVTEKVGSAFFTTRSENPGEPVVDLFCGHFTVGAGAGALLFDSMPDPIHVSFGRSDDADRVLRQLSDLMRGEAEREGQGTAAILSALCTALLAMMLRTSAGTATSARLWTAASDPNITAVIDAVREDPAYEWSQPSDVGHRTPSDRRPFGRSGGVVGRLLFRIGLLQGIPFRTRSDTRGVPSSERGSLTTAEGGRRPNAVGRRTRDAAAP
jgi:AraC family transcriptional activator of mtrCDE